MGIVYEAEHETLGRHVAIKILRKSVLKDHEMVRRFLGEAIAAARIRHSGVVTVYDFGHLSDGATYLVMEYLEGETLSRAMIEGEAMTIERVVELGRQIATTLAHAHAAGIVHRDLKPDNIYVVRDAHGAERTKLLDFGVAKFIQQELLTSMQTQLGKILGTPWYMPPEQCQGAEVDERSDIYSLGCVLFQMACGRVPFPGKLTEVLAAHRESTPPSARSLNPSIPKSLEKLIFSMMAKDPRQRPQSMTQVERALRKLDLTVEQLEARALKSIPPMAMPQTIARESTDRVVMEPRRTHRKTRAIGLAIAVTAALGAIIGLGAYYM
jgi:serine/threonine-protein kinase